jgi:spermidine synthase
VGRSPRGRCGASTRDSGSARETASAGRTAISLWPLAGIFAISGAGALVAETIWMRWLRDWMGATAPAAAATTTAFLAGSSLGAWLGARRARSAASRGEALRAYRAAEILAAAGALATPLLLDAASRALAGIYDVIAHDRAALALLRFAVALAVTLPAAAAYGATFPLIGAAALSSPREMGSRGAALYAAHSLGAVLGVALAAWWAPPSLGVRVTYGLGVALALTAAAGAWLLGGGAAGAPRRAAAAPAARALLSQEAVVLSALSGFVALGAQVLLVHAFALVVNQSVIAFGAVLIAVLLCLAIGASGVAAMRTRGLASSRGIAGWSLAAGALLFALTPAWIHRTTGGLDTIAAEAFGLPYGWAVVASVLAAAGPALLIAACIWPATLALAGESDLRPGGALPSPTGGEAGARLGMLWASNTLGAIAAGLVTPFAVIPSLGPWGGFLVVAAACGLGAACVRPAAGARRSPRLAVVGLGGAVVLLVANPLSLPLTRPLPGVRVLYESAGAAGTVSVLERGGERVIRLDNHYGLGGTSEQTHEQRQGHLPLLLHGRPERVAFVGAATGITAGAALAHDVEEITLVEIVPDVAAAGAAYFADANGGVYQDPRSRVVLDDARNYWRHTEDRFDVIVADLFVPWRAGTGSLYTREHFAAMRERLRPGGLVAQWLPLYQLSDDELAILLATFGDVFPTAALFRGDFYGEYPIVALIGWRDDAAAATDVAAAARRLAAAGVADRWVTNPDALWSLYVAPLPPDASGRVPRNLAGWPRLEFMAAERHVGGGRGKLDPLVGLAWTRRIDEWQATSPEPDVLHPDLPESARRARRGGSALQRAGALHAAGRADEAAAQLGLAAELLPGSVLAEAPADTSAADVWFEGRPAPE